MSRTLADYTNGPAKWSFRRLVRIFLFLADSAQRIAPLATAFRKALYPMMRIRVTTRANLFDKRKQEHIERGYRIEEERPTPVNGFCSFVAVRELSVSDKLSDLVAEALNVNSAARRDW